MIKAISAQCKSIKNTEKRTAEADASLRIDKVEASLSSFQLQKIVTLRVHNYFE